MRSEVDPVLTSYLKTAFSSSVLVIASLALNLAGSRWLPAMYAIAVIVLSTCVLIGATVFAVASGVVLARWRRAKLGKPDLFLDLNRSRDAAAIAVARAPSASRLRRWFAVQMLGHDLVVGDWVEVKTWAEIRATLDERGCLQELPFMPEMLAMCGQPARVFRCVHRLFDYRKSRRMRHMDGAVLLVGAVCDGSKHGGCEAACHTIWKSAWLRRVDHDDARTGATVSSNHSHPLNAAAVLQFGTQAPRYVCQLTQLHAASQAVGNWSAINFLRPLVAGNVAPLAFVIGWLTHLFNGLQQKRGGVSFPAFEPARAVGERPDEVHLVVDDAVVVRGSAEIRATLNDQMLNRGLWFEPDMLKHCGRRHFVQAEVTKLIDIVSGEMRTMKTPAFVLRGVHFSGERQLFNAQYEPLFWRSAWLHRESI